jgi:hypothetical protein
VPCLIDLRIIVEKDRITQAEPLTPKEVKAARLVPYEILNRWGYSSGTEVSGLPEQVRHEYYAAQKATDESERNGTLKEDYPQLYRTPGPFDDLVSTGGVMIHEWQL